MTSETGSSSDFGDPAEVVHRLATLERRLAAVEKSLATLVPTAAPPPANVVGRVAPAPPPPPPLRSRPSSAEPPSMAPPSPDPLSPARTPRNISSITTESVLKWAGIVLVALAALFFVSTAISRGWIGPTAQLASATAGGAAMVWTGWSLRTVSRSWALALTHGGLVVLGICAGAAHAWLDLIGLGVAVVAVGAVVAVALVQSMNFEDVWIAVTGLAVGLAVPGVIGAYDSYGMAFSSLWFLALVAIAVALSVVKSWSIPRILGLFVIGSTMMLSAFLDGDATTTDKLVLQLAIAAAGLMWWAGPWIRPAEGNLRSADWRLVIIIPGLVWMISQQLWAVTEGEVALVGGIVAIAFALLTVAARSVAGKPPVPAMARPLTMSHVVGVSVVASASLGLWLDGPSLLLALTAQAVGVAALAGQTRDRWLGLNAAVLWALVGLWTATGIVEGLDVGLSWQFALSYLIVLAAAGAVAAFVRLEFPQPAGAVAAGAWIGLLLWIMAVVGPLPQGQMIVSMIWAGFGGSIFVAGLGLISDQTAGVELWPGWRRHLRQAGFATLTATVMKLVTVDLAEVDTIWRAGLFALIGFGLLRLGFSVGVLSRRQQESAIEGP